MSAAVGAAGFLARNRILRSGTEQEEAARIVLESGVGQAYRNAGRVALARSEPVPTARPPKEAA